MNWDVGLHPFAVVLPPVHLVHNDTFNTSSSSVRFTLKVKVVPHGPDAGLTKSSDINGAT